MTTILELSKDVEQILQQAEQESGISRSSIVETAILFWHAEKGKEWGFKPNGQAKEQQS